MRFDNVLAICVTVVVLAVLAVCYVGCEGQQDRRAACIKDGHPPLECRAVFDSYGGGAR